MRNTGIALVRGLGRMKAREFLLHQSFHLNARNADAVALDFEIPLIVVRGRDARIVFSEEELLGHLDELFAALARVGGARVQRALLHQQAPGKTLAMLSFRDTVVDREGRPIGEFHGTFALNRNFGARSISILIVDQAPEGCFDFLFETVPTRRRAVR